ncbi:MAG: sulfotransferase [Alphaproteobacteria bacterium]|nr:sulfotransferase [Alphaproteobacteria bacterium]
MTRFDSTLRLRLRAASPVSLGRLPSHLWWRLDLLRHGWPLRRPAPHARPVFVLGHQKTGSSAVGAMLAEVSGEAAALDLAAELARPLHLEVEAGRKSFDDFLHHNAVDLSRRIVKDACLAALAAPLAARFPAARFVFVVRDPRATVRSVLDRVGLPGDRAHYDEAILAGVPRAWREVLLPAGADAGDVVAHIAERWRQQARVALAGDLPVRVIRYEDFCRAPRAETEAVARDVGLPVLPGDDRAARQQWQPAGEHRGRWPAFLGDANVARIDALCRDEMRAFHYGGPS